MRVVHGKGLGSPGKQPVLKAKVQRWLIQKNEVLAFVQATPAEGGARRAGGAAGAGAAVAAPRRSARPLSVRIQSAVWKNESRSRARSASGTPVSPIAWSMQASHWSRSLMPIEWPPMLCGMCRARSIGWPKRSV